MRNTGWSIIRTVWTGMIPISWRCVDSQWTRPDFHSASSGSWTHVLAPKARHDQADLQRRHQQPVSRSAHNRNNCNLLKWLFEITCLCCVLGTPCPPCFKCVSAPTYLIQINGSLSDLRTSWLFVSGVSRSTAATRCSEHHPGLQILDTKDESGSPVSYLGSETTADFWIVSASWFVLITELHCTTPRVI